MFKEITFNHESTEDILEGLLYGGVSLRELIDTGEEETTNSKGKKCTVCEQRAETILAFMEQWKDDGYRSNEIYKALIEVPEKDRMDDATLVTFMLSIGSSELQNPMIAFRVMLELASERDILKYLEKKHAHYMSKGEEGAPFFTITAVGRVYESVSTIREVQDSIAEAIKK